jgi:NTE family protein
LGSKPKTPEPGAYRHGGVLDTTGLENFVIREVPWRNIRRNLHAGKLSSLSISATHVGTGHTVVFVDVAKDFPKAWSRNPFIRHRKAAIGPRHALASAAIPLLFPAVKVQRSFYVDGGLRHNTPMSPAIRLGADRLLVISLRHKADKSEEAILVEERESAYPSPLYLAGKALNSLLLDPTEYDLERMERINAILDAGTAAFGSEFEEVIGKEMKKRRGAALRRLHCVHISPSEDIGAMAANFIKSDRLKLEGRVARRLIHRLARSEAGHEADLLSYLLFDGDFAQELMDLGYRDAAAHEEELLETFG